MFGRLSRVSTHLGTILSVFVTGTDVRYDGVLQKGVRLIARLPMTCSEAVTSDEMQLTNAHTTFTATERSCPLLSKYRCRCWMKYLTMKDGRAAKGSAGRGQERCACEFRVPGNSGSHATSVAH